MNTPDIELRCARHPKVETGLRCGTCDTPICPRCAVYTPVGAKCPDCARNKTGLFHPSALQTTSAAVVALFAGVVGGWVMGVLDLRILLILLAIPFGGAVGELVLRASGRRRGRLLEIVTGVTFALGAIGGRMVIGYMIMSLNPMLGKSYTDLFLEAIRPFPFAPAAIAIALGMAVSRIRYL